MHSASRKQFKVRALIIIIHANPLTLRAKFIPTKIHSLLRVYQRSKNIIKSLSLPRWHNAQEPLTNVQEDLTTLTVPCSELIYSTIKHLSKLVTLRAFLLILTFYDVSSVLDKLSTNLLVLMTFDTRKREKLILLIGSNSC